MSSSKVLNQFIKNMPYKGLRDAEQHYPRVGETKVSTFEQQLDSPASAPAPRSAASIRFGRSSTWTITQ